MSPFTAACSVLMKLDFYNRQVSSANSSLKRQRLEVNHLHRVRIAKGQESIRVEHHMLYLMRDDSASRNFVNQYLSER